MIDQHLSALVLRPSVVAYLASRAQLALGTLRWWPPAAVALANLSLSSG